MFQSHVSLTSYSSHSDMREALIASWPNLSEEVLKKLCTSADKGLRVIVDEKGGHIELYVYVKYCQQLRIH